MSRQEGWYKGTEVFALLKIKQTLCIAVKHEHPVCISTLILKAGVEWVYSIMVQVSLKSGEGYKFLKAI